MVNQDKYYGICINCNNAPYCINSKKAENPVWYCDMFDNYAPTPERTSEVKKVTKPTIKKDDHHKYKGLCVNCENKETCIYATREGGVWHCAEYR